MKRFLLLLVATTAAFAAFAQNDSLTFVNAQWSVKDVAKGITLKEFHFTGDNQLFESNQYISIVEIDTKKAKGRFALANDPGKITPTSKFAKDSNAVVAMNGTFYNMRPNYNSVCYFKKFGVPAYDFTEKMEQRDNGAITIDNKGALKVVIGALDGKGLTLKADWAKYLEAPNVMGSGPVLMMKGKAAPLVENSFNKGRHPRSAVATDGKKVYLITADGRTPEAQGVSLWEFTSIMRYIGVRNAINFDGGGSTTLYVRGENETGIVNHPSDNKKFDREGERHIVNALLYIQ